MKIAPRYITRPSQDVSFFDLLEPATEWDFEEAVSYHLYPLAGVSWRLTRRGSRILSRLQNEWRCDAATVKQRLLRIVLPDVLAHMHERQRVRFGASWLKDAKGDVRTLVPARDLGHVREPSGLTTYSLDPYPTAEDVDAFGRCLEQALLRKAIGLLDEYGDVLHDVREWYGHRDGHDALAHASAMCADDVNASRFERPTNRPPDVHILATEYEEAVRQLTRLGAETKALLDVLKAVHRGECAWSRHHQLRRDRIAMELRTLRASFPEVDRLVRTAWLAADQLGGLGAPLPAVSLAQ